MQDKESLTSKLNIEPGLVNTQGLFPLFLGG